ncbi:HAMP domain-containing sensor histidine kinase [Nocardia sp. CDC186]|uniref:Signal transduction histidine-protein kinase/phosphatase MprB n=1 Tax=Nocardia implantans TaxID=3108168 RepID=A0ABU6B4S1_9NOCA|nr:MULTISPECIES: HAMP domain-containing sensor histidine kinase [unclassified Nocardia]MBF6196189.1 HAMP domain-containing histidine kinase [Nocardia beijingensis]MEA3532829.1 HAMP domain-containing sensor histidine kinase [Nocardia sp. CDC192]MEB3514701.1 HAMP domain-containing sensor histidine kinase [Nocardia sp. CDC186]
MKRPVSLCTRVALASATAATLVAAAMCATFFALAPSGAEQQVDKAVRSLRITAVTPTEPNSPLPLLDSIPPPPPMISEAPNPPTRDTNSTPGSSGARPSIGRYLFLTQRADDAGPDSHLTWDVPTQVAPGSTVLVAASVPQQTLAQTVADQRNRILAVGAAAIAIAAGLGWFFAHRAVLPLRKLTTATANVGTRLSLDVPPAHGTTETAELTAAMNRMLDRIAEERHHTADALAAARDFAATSAHELRTPLTSMRTDLQVLRTMDLPEADRHEILDDILTTQRSVEDTLMALERLALGQLATADDFDDVDLDDLIDQIVEDAHRTHPDITVDSTVTEPLRIRGLAAGLRSILENAVTNSVRHGHAIRVDINARRDGDRIELTVDDNGTGIPERDRERLFDRFTRGDTTASGSGLGLALVAQQAGLHGGTAQLTDSPLGGTRLWVTLRDTPRDF